MEPLCAYIMFLQRVVLLKFYKTVGVVRKQVVSKKGLKKMTDPNTNTH